MLVVLHLFALFLLVSLGFYVFVADPRSRANQTFAAFIAFLALWTTKDLVFWNFVEAQVNAGWWAAASFIIALLMQFSLAVFAWVFPENSRTPRKRAAVLFAPGLVLIPAAITGILWKRVGFENGRFEIELAPLAFAFVGYVYFVFFYGAKVLFTKYRKYRGTQKGQQLGAILWGLAITGILKTLANIVFPFFDIYELLPYSSIFVLPGVLIYAYAISNFRLLSLQSALDQFRLFPISYKVALSIASVAILSFVLFQIPIVWWAFYDGMSFEAWRKYLVFSLISALIPNLLLVLLVVRTISRPLQRLTVAAVQVIRGGYGTEVDLRKTNDEIGLLADSFNEMSRKMASDIESLKQMNDQLMRTDRLAAMGTLAAGVAHEVNNPLASISSLIQMMRSGKLPEDEFKEKLDLVYAQIRRISQVTNDLTDFARVRPAAKKKIQLNDVLAASLRLANLDESFQRLDLRTEFDEDLPLTFADGDQLQQVFLNLLLNARDALPDNGVVSIRSSQNNGSIAVEVSDTGTGIEHGDSTRVFDPFYTTKRPGKGTGLGLAVCYGIVTSHGGKIEIAPNEPAGTRFTVLIPITDVTI